METSWVIQGTDGMFVISLAASVIAGALIAFIMDYSAGPHPEPFWMAAMISAGSGATIAVVAHVLKEAPGLSIWAAMVFGAGCGALGVLGYSLITRRGGSGAPPRSHGRQNRADVRSSRESWRLPRSSSRTGFSTPDFRQRKFSASNQEGSK